MPEVSRRRPHARTTFASKSLTTSPPPTRVTRSALSRKALLLSVGALLLRQNMATLSGSPRKKTQICRDSRGTLFFFFGRGGREGSGGAQRETYGLCAALEQCRDMIGVKVSAEDGFLSRGMTTKVRHTFMEECI